jgi:kynurenine formamidase
MRIVDLTRPLRHGLPVYPGDPPVRVEPLATVETDGYAVARLELSDQAGTHVETQAHFLAGGRTLDAEPLARCIGPASVVDVPCGPIGVEHLAPHAAHIAARPFLLLRSGYGDRVATIDPGDPQRPRLALDALAWLVARGVRLLGIDCFDFDADPGYAGHRYLLARDVLVVEGLVNLGQLPAHCWLYVVPLLVVGTGGAPCRAFAMLDA